MCMVSMNSPNSLPTMSEYHQSLMLVGFFAMLNSAVMELLTESAVCLEMVKTLCDFNIFPLYYNPLYYKHTNLAGCLFQVLKVTSEGAKLQYTSSTVTVQNVSLYFTFTTNRIQFLAVSFPGLKSPEWSAKLCWLHGAIHFNLFHLLLPFNLASNFKR